MSLFDRTASTAQKTRIAIVEDNATARMNLRSHLIAMDNYDIASYSNGKEFRNGLRVRNFDVAFIDFHLGQNKNGVEWVQSLLDAKVLVPSTSIIFVTSDRLPQTIGQILDLYPDMILIKPYTIKSVMTALKQCISARKHLMPALSYVDEGRLQLALNYVDDKLTSGVTKRFKTDFIKLKGRLLIQLKHYDQAATLYSKILERSNSVLWAHWGLIKSEFLGGKWQQCETMVEGLLSAQLTKDKAHEWLACLALSKKDYAEAEKHLDNIKDNELTIQATKLKILAFSMQNKKQHAIDLLEKKRSSNLTIKERFDEFTIELARCYLSQAEDSHIDERVDDLMSAKKLIGNASHFMIDRQSEQQRTYMLARASLLEGDTQKATRLVNSNPHKNDTLSKITTMSDAIKVWFGLGHEEKAREILASCEEQLLDQDNQIELLLADNLINETEIQLGLTKEKALNLNDRGMQHYLSGKHKVAVDLFYKAHNLYPGVPAFSLNLLQCLADLNLEYYKDVSLQLLIDDLSSINLSTPNQQKLISIRDKIKFA